MTYELPPIVRHSERLHLDIEVAVRGFTRGNKYPLRDVSALWASYQGHFEHASSYRLRLDFYRRFPWLQSATACNRRFPPSMEGRVLTIPTFVSSPCKSFPSR